LEKIVVDENTTRRVSQTATQILESVRLVEQKAEEEKRVREEEERLAREKAEADRIAKEEAERLLAEQKAEEQRIAEEKRLSVAGVEAERLAATQKAEQEQLAREKAKVEFKAQEKEQGFSAQKADRGSKILLPKKILAAIPVTIGIISCIIILTVLSLIRTLPASSVSPGISNLNIPSFSAGEDVYVYFDLDQPKPGLILQSRWYIKLGFLGTNSFFPIGRLNYTTTNEDTKVYFHLKNPGIAAEYRVDIYMNQSLVGTRTFVIYPR
jgi:hypothetical protein